ncbi:MAG: hypothetical protein ABIR79_23135 [Candidatus Binatia bacterium]
MPETEPSAEGCRATDGETRDSWSHEVTIEPNGSEYLVTIKGAVFVALSRAQAEALAVRMRGRK